MLWQQVGETAVSDVSKKIKALVHQWVESAESSTEADVTAKSIIAEYNTVNEPAAKPVDESALATSIGAQDDCSEDGCEIVW